MTRLGRVLGVCILTVVGTLFLGWWSVPIAAALIGWFDRRARHPAIDGALGAALGWAILLARYAAYGDLRGFGAMLGGVLHVPAWAPTAITLAYAAALGAAGAALGAALAATLRRPLPQRRGRVGGRPPR